MLLALATGLLALLTRAEVLASRQELMLSRTALEGSTRPILVDAPLDVFRIERESRTIPILSGLSGESGTRWIEDLAKIDVAAGNYSGRNEAEGYARIAVPLHNVGPGLALIRDARLSGFDPGWPIPWRWSTRQTAAPPGQLAVITFRAAIDPGDADGLSSQLQELDEPMDFSVEVDYSDINGEQRTRTVVTVEGFRSYWRVTDVALYEEDSTEPFISLHREAAVAPSSPGA